MPIRPTGAVLLCLGTGFGFSQPAKPPSEPAPIFQPGAPGKPGKSIPPAVAARLSVRTPVEADISFMQGMIHHHAQAVEMVDLLRTRGRRKDLLAFGERITISQSDEILSMKLWLTDRGLPVAPPHDHSQHMHGMPMMPGMLTAEQMTALAKAKGSEFDRLFLTGMIQHHIGALVMVEDLFATPGAGQEPVLYDFATDVDNTQRAEIGIMRGMLKEKR